VAARRAGQPRRLKALEPEAARLLGLAVEVRRSRSGSTTAPSPAAVRMLSGSHSAPTWNRYLSTLRAWERYAALAGIVFLPAEPGHFANFLAEMAERDVGSTQSKQRACAIRAISAVAGVRSPLADEDVDAVRRGIRRSLRGGRRGSARPIYAHEIPAEPPASPPSRGRGRWALMPVSVRRRARAQATRHMSVLSGASLRFDDLQEGQLGDVLWHDGLADLSLFGTKTDRELRGQPAVLAASPAPNSGFQALLEGTRAGLARLGALDATVLAALARSFSKSLSSEEQVGGEQALASWPADVRALAAPLYRAGLPVHCLPIYGAWQSERLTPDSDLRREVPRADFVRLSRDVLQAAGVDTARLGAHSFRQGGAGALFHAGAGQAAVSEVLRHRSAASTRPYVLEASRMAATAVTIAACAARGRGLPGGTPRGALRGLGQGPPHGARGLVPPPVGGGGPVAPSALGWVTPGFGPVAAADAQLRGPLVRGAPVPALPGVRAPLEGYVLDVRGRGHPTAHGRGGARPSV